MAISKISIRDGVDISKFSSEYERGLLALVIRHADLFTDLNQKITADHFLYLPNKIIYTALCSLINNPKIKNIDIESLIIEVNKLDYISIGGSIEYLTIVSESGFDRENYEFYYSKVNDAYIKYKLAVITSYANSLIDKNAKDSENSLSSEDLLANITESISKLATFKGREDEGKVLGEVVRDFVITRADNATDVRGLRTGLPHLDQAINGLLPGNLIIIAGVAKAGKSTVLANIVDYIAIESGIIAKERGEPDPTVPVLMISTEMNWEEDLGRLLAMRTGEEERLISNGLAYKDKLLRKKVNKAIEQIENSKIYHVYLPDFNATKVCNIITHYKTKYDIKLAVFDYIKLDTVGTTDKREDQILGDLTTALKNTAGKLWIPILTACQINSRTNRVADSDRIERYCNSLIYFMPKTMEELQQQDFKKHGTHWLYVHRNRSGGNSKIPVRFFKKSFNISEAEPFESDQLNEESLLLTTPTEFARLQEEHFRIKAVTNIISQKDIKEDIFIGEEDDDDI